jgi:ATP-dependent RNA helicase RhlE
MQFSSLNIKKPILEALAENGFTTATSIQQKAFAPIMAGENVCGIAQTGTGKTLAYLLPIINLWKYNKEKRAQIAIIVPTRELVMQVVDAAKILCSNTSAIVIGVYGGTNINTQALLFADGADIVVGTPGRMYDLIMSGAFKTSALKRIVIDEMDELLQLGFKRQVENILDLLPQKYQSLLFSATITESVQQFIDTFFINTTYIEAAPSGTALENINQTRYNTANFNTKLNLLCWLLQNDASMNKVMVFVANKSIADNLHESLQEIFPEKVGVIHSNKAQNNRFDTVNKFYAGEYNILIATDIVARGIDIVDVSHVINIDVPIEPENYMHRIGRTGRADKKGIAIVFVTEKEQEAFEAIETLMKRKVDIAEWPSEVEISTVLIEEEIERPYMKPYQVKADAAYEGGGAFHEKSAKNQKVNTVISKKDRMMAKYGKPKKRRPKR